jgi:hypothetical protein
MNFAYALICPRMSNAAQAIPNKTNHVATMLPGGSVTAWKPLEMLGSVLHHVAMKKGLQTLKALIIQYSYDNQSSELTTD